MSDNQVEYYAIKAKNNTQALEELMKYFYDYIGFVKEARRFSTMIPGLDFHDCLQIMVMALIQAVKTFNPKKSQFCTFAIRCGISDLKTERRRAINQGNHALTYYLSFSEPCNDDPGSLTWGEILTIYNPTPEEIVIIKMELKEKIMLLKDADLELKVLSLYCFGFSIAEIAQKLSLANPKSADNALNRVRNKFDITGQRNRTLFVGPVFLDKKLLSTYN